MERHYLERRHLITGAGALGASSVFAPSVVRAQEVCELRMVTAWPKDSAGLGVNAQRLADMIGTMSGGRLAYGCSRPANSYLRCKCLTPFRMGAQSCRMPLRISRQDGMQASASSGTYLSG